MSSTLSIKSLDCSELHEVLQQRRTTALTFLSRNTNNRQFIVISDWHLHLRLINSVQESLRTRFICYSSLCYKCVERVVSSGRATQLFVHVLLNKAPAKSALADCCSRLHCCTYNVSRARGKLAHSRWTSTTTTTSGLHLSSGADLIPVLTWQIIHCPCPWTNTHYLFYVLSAVE